MRRLFALVMASIMGASLLVLIITGCGQPSPAETINNALNNRQSHHADFDTSAQFNLKPSDQLPAFLTGMPPVVTTRGGADMSLDSDRHSARGDISIGGLDLIKIGISASGAGGSQSNISNLLNVASNINSFVMVDNVTYVKVSDTWYTADAGTLRTLLGPVGETFGNVSIDTSCMTDAMKDTSRFGAETLFTNLQEQSGEQIDGVDTRHFIGSVNFDAILTQLSAAAAACGNPQAASGLDAARADIKSLFSKADVELWIDSSNNIRQVKTDFIVNGQVAQTVIGILSGIGTAQLPGIELDTVEVTGTMKNSQFGASFDITKPSQAGFSKLDDLLGGSAAATGSASGSAGGAAPGTSTSGGTSTGSSTTGY